MKTKKLFVVAALLPLLFSCAKEEIVNNDNLNGEGKKYDFTITVSEDEESFTKASFDDKSGIFWEKGGKAGIVKKDGDKTFRYESNPLDNIYPFNGHNQASFAFKETYEGEYKFFYPYHSEATLDKIPFWVDPNQKTSAGSSADCFALVSKDMVSLTVDNHDIGAFTTYKVVGSYIRFLPFGKENDIVKSIVIEGAGNTVSGRYFVNGNDNTLVSGVDYNAGTITLEVEDNYEVAAAKENAQGLYTPVLPGKSKNSYIVLTDKGFYLFESGSEKEFNFGEIKDIPLNLKKAARTPKSLFVIGDATTAGWTADDAIPLTKVEGENKYKIENIQLVPGGEGFKFLTKKGQWSKVFVNAGENKLAYYGDVPAADKDIKFKVDKAGFYDLVVDFDAFTVTTNLKTEFPRVVSYKNKNTYWMMPTETEGEFKVSRVYIGIGDDGERNFFIYEGEEAYHESEFKGIVSFTNNVYSGTVSKDNKKDLGWWIKDENNQTNRWYDITLNKNTSTVTVKFTQGKKFWLIGEPFNGWVAEKLDKYGATVENGIATWNVTTTKKGEWKICGENTQSFWFGEWYYSNANDDKFNWSWDGGNNYGQEFDVNVFCGDKKWNFNETGTFEIVFDTKNLKIKVTKK